MEKTKKTLDETKFEFPEDLDAFREEIIKNLRKCANAVDMQLVLSEYYAEITGRLAVGEA